MCYDYMSIGSGRPITYGSNIDTLKSISNNIKFIGIWLQTFNKNYVLHCNTYKDKINELFKKIPQTLHVNKPGNFNKTEKISR